MSDYLVTVRTSLRPDPDDGSPEIISLEAASRVARLHDLGTWAKVSNTDQNGKTVLGWLHADVLKEITAAQITLFDEPFGQSRVVVGEVIGEKVQLPPWKKIRVRLADGSVVEGWVDTSGAAGGSTDTDSPGANDPGDGDGGNLVLGPNEIYRPHLLKAEDITNIDAAAIAALIDAEAAKKPNGQWDADSEAGTSSAAGLTQFLKATWLAQAETNNTLLNRVCKEKGHVTAGNDVVAGSEQAVLDLRFDPELSIVTAAEYGLFNLTALIKAGLVDEEVGDDEKARFIYIAHHEGLGGATGFLNGTNSYIFANLVTQVGNSKAQAYVDAAGGDATKAYRNWLEDYVERHIQPSKFRKPGSGDSNGTSSGSAGPICRAADPDHGTVEQERPRQSDSMAALGTWISGPAGRRHVRPGLDLGAERILRHERNWARREFHQGHCAEALVSNDTSAEDHRNRNLVRQSHRLYELPEIFYLPTP